MIRRANGAEEVNWFSVLPNGWRTERLKRVVSLVTSGVSVNASDVPAESHQMGVLKTSAVSDGRFLPSENKTVWDTEINRLNCSVTKDTIVVSRMNTPTLVGASGYISDDFENLYLPDRLWKLEFDRSRVHTPFMSYVLASEGARAVLSCMATGTSPSMKNLSIEELGSLSIPLPDKLVQERIARFISTKIKQIDSLIFDKEKMLALLEEKRVAFISRIVTRGLDKAVPLKSSGHAWLGKVPVHWEVWRLKHLAEVRGGLTLGKQYDSSELYPYQYLRVANVQDGFLALNNVSTLEVPSSEAKANLLAYGDVLMNEGGDIDKLGRGCVWRDEIKPCLHQNHVFAVRPHSVDSEWLALWTSTLEAKRYFEMRAKRSTNLASISGSNIKELAVPIPPIAEQQAIKRHLDTAAVRTEAIRKELAESISLLRERRAALITDAVTGKIPLEEMTA